MKSLVFKPINIIKNLHVLFSDLTISVKAKFGVLKNDAFCKAIMSSDPNENFQEPLSLVHKKSGSKDVGIQEGYLQEVCRLLSQLRASQTVNNYSVQNKLILKQQISNQLSNQLIQARDGIFSSQVKDIKKQIELGNLNDGEFQNAISSLSISQKKKIINLA